MSPLPRDLSMRIASSPTTVNRTDSRRATRRNALLILVILSLYALACRNAEAAPLQATAASRFSLELKPLSMSQALHSGGGAFAAEAEACGREHWSLFLGLAHLRSQAGAGATDSPEDQVQPVETSQIS